MFAPTGVYPLYPTVHVNEGDDYAKLTWLIFDSNVPITIRSFQGGTLLTDGISSEVDGITVAEGNDCISTVTGESTTVWNVFIDKPNSSAEGDYILVVNNRDRIGQSSATVHLIVDSISPSSTIKMISSTSLVDSPTDAPFSIAPLTIGILIVVVSVVIMLIDGVLIIILIAYLKKHKSCNKHKPENIEMSEHSSIEICAASSPTTSFHEVILSPTSQSSDTFLIDLMDFLESKLCSKWYQFGHHLKLPTEELHKIELKVGQDNEQCTRQVLFMWRKLNPAASWEPIAEALEQSGLSLLSAIVTKRYTNPGPTFCRICQCTHGLDYPDFDIHDVLTSIPNNLLLQSAPDISKLSDLVGAEIPAKWELFGVQVGLEQSYLDCLREHHDSKIRFIHLFNEWKTRKTSDFTWATVIKVLYSKTISEYTLAENVLKKLKSATTD